jgi:transcription antitermination factor NusG
MGLQNKQWFVAKTRANQERSVRERLEAMSIETYLPSRVEVRQRRDRKKKVEVVLIPNTLFIHTDKHTALSLPNHHGFLIKYMIDCMTRTLLVVPEKQMQNFMFLMDVSDDSIKVDNGLLFTKGDKIRVIKGAFAGIEGELIRVDGKRKVMVRLDNIIACSIEIPGSYLEKM